MSTLRVKTEIGLVLSDRLMGETPVPFFNGLLETGHWSVFRAFKFAIRNRQFAIPPGFGTQRAREIESEALH